MDCNHHYSLESIETPSGSKGTTRLVHVICDHCEERRMIYTQRTEEEIHAELAVQ